MLKWLLIVPFCLFGSLRDYSDKTPDRVVKHYRDNHEQMTLEFVLQKKQEYGSLNHAKMTIFEAIDLVDQLIDESDPDLDLPQSFHFYQTAEALRRDGHPRWLILTGFIHDLGKVLAHFGEPSWAVVGDTYPVGLPFSEKIVFSHFFENNPDFGRWRELGIYQEGCGLDQVHMAWGHDEYLYTVLKDYLPEEALYVIRYHSFYAHHQARAYDFLMNEKDRKMLPLLQLFQKYDLYSKDNSGCHVKELEGYYRQLVNEFLPRRLSW